LNIFCGLSAEGDDGIAEMRERILPGLKDFRFVGKEGRDGLGIETGRWGGTQCPGKCHHLPR